MTRLLSLLGEEKIAIAGGPIFYAEPHDMLWSAGMRIDALTGIELRVGHNERINQVGEVKDLDYLSGCAIIFKKKMIDEIGLFDETFFLYSEEVDWTFRAIRLGYKFKFNHSAIVWHRASSTMRKNPSKGYYYFIRARFRIYFIHFPPQYLVTSLFFQLTLYPFFEALFFKTSGLYVLERLKAFSWNIVNLRGSMNKRSEVDLLGRLKLKNRFRELIARLIDDRASKFYEF
jgi:GT2 family glycosyltransferase